MITPTSRFAALTAQGVGAAPRLGEQNVDADEDLSNSVTTMRALSRLTPYVGCKYSLRASRRTPTSDLAAPYRARVPCSTGQTLGRPRSHCRPLDTTLPRCCRS